MNAEDSIIFLLYYLIYKNPNDSLGGMAERTNKLFIYSERSEANSITELDIKRVHIRPRIFLLDY
jgi:hypothetical protein